MDKLEAMNRLASSLTVEQIENLTDEEVLNVVMERPGHPGTFGFMFNPRYFRSNEHLAKNAYAMMKRFGKIENVKDKMKRKFEEVTPEEFCRIANAAVEAAREKIRAGKGDPEKQKTCPHPFDSLRGDLLHGPCICDDCGKVIAE